MQQQGLTIIEYNFFWPGGEIDLVARDKDEIVFIEVKYRDTDEYGSALEHIRKSQIRKIHQSAMLFLEQHPELASFQYRFDAIGMMPLIDSSQTSNPSISYSFQSDIQFVFENYNLEWLQNCF